jgi:hypothetical protein
LIERNLEKRTLFLEKSLARYQEAGEGFEKLVQEYLSTHVAILQCEEEIDRLKRVHSAGTV